MQDLAPILTPPAGDLGSSNAPASYLANLAPSGRRTMQSALARVAQILTGRDLDAFVMPWSQVRYEHASAVRAILQAQYAPATVNKHLTALRGVMRECWRLGLIDGDTLARIVDIPNVKGKRLPAGRMLSKEELTTLWCTADVAPPQYGACLALLFSAGLRRSEAASVTWGGVKSTVDALGSETWWVTVVGKGDKERRVPVRGSGACRLSRLWVEQQRHDRKGWRDEPILGTSQGRSVAKMLEKLVAAAGIPHASCHDLRRSFVSHALAGGAPIADVARVAGHADPRTTAGYDRRADDALVGVADALPD